jgi:hypothetical protein
MRKLTTLVCFVSLSFASAVCLAASPFDGTWRPDPQRPGPGEKPDNFEISNGMYSCLSCDPPSEIKTDGQDHPITGSQYYDTLSVTLVDTRTVVKVAKAHGQIVAKTTMVVADNGTDRTDQQTVYGMGPNPLAFTMKFSRLTAGKLGDNLLSGQWKLIETDLTNHDEDTTYKITGDSLAMSDKLGRSFTAKLDGTPAPYVGDPDFNMVSVKMLNPSSLEETDLRDGKPVKITLWTVSADGTAIHARFDNLHGKVEEQDGHEVR